MISQAELRSWFAYSPETGLFSWLRSPERSRIEIGSPAGSINKQHGKQRRVIWLQGKRLYASRAAYVYMHGDIQNGALVDHIDGDTLNDRLSNLRLASAAQNTWNRIQRDGAPRMLGVSKEARGRFKARVQLPTGDKLNLGTWATEEEAHAAYMGAAAILHSEFWIGRRP